MNSQEQLFWWSLLPVRSHATLIGSLSEFWLKLSRAPWLALTSISHNRERIHLVCRSAEGKVGAASVSCSQGAGWSLANVREGIFRCGEEQLPRLDGTAVVRLESGSETIGSLHLLKSDWDLVPDGERTTSREWTIRLIEQARLVEASLFEDSRFSDGLRDEKLESLAELAAGAGHEINNPLATISGRAQLLLRDEDDPERRQWLLAIGAQAHRVRDMIGDLMIFARPPRPVPRVIEMSEFVRRVVASRQTEATARLCDLSLEFTPLSEAVREIAGAPSVTEEGETPLDAPARAQGVKIFADPVQLMSAVSALIDNSLQAMRDGGTCRVAIYSKSRDGRCWGIVEVSDNGPGLKELDRRHLFDPFYSGRPAGRGLGFGLSKVWRIVTNHQGHVEVKSPNESGIGATFRCYWPASPDQGPATIGT